VSPFNHLLPLRRLHAGCTLPVPFRVSLLIGSSPFAVQFLPNPGLHTRSLASFFYVLFFFPPFCFCCLFSSFLPCLFFPPIQGSVVFCVLVRAVLFRTAYPPPAYPFIWFTTTFPPTPRLLIPQYITNPFSWFVDAEMQGLLWRLGDFGSLLVAFFLAVNPVPGFFFSLCLGFVSSCFEQGQT